jgi:ubiquinone/menaquinone biosynthesis C-methylase UbiE
MLAIARGKSVEDILLADARFLPFRDRSFDATMSVHVLHLIRDWERALAEIKRVTEKVYLSVIRSSSRGHSLIEIYDDMLMESGWERVHPGMRERDLIKEKPPLENTFVATFHYGQEVDSALPRLEQRQYSSLFDVPEDLHKRIIETLKREYSGKVFDRSEDLSICLWDVGKL